MHCFDLLLTLGTSVVQSLVLLLDKRDLAFDLLVPLGVGVLLTFLVLLFELANFLELSLFFNLQNGLLNRLGEQNVQNGLHLTIILKEVVVANLGLLVDASLLGHILGRWRFRHEFICLSLHVVLLGDIAALLCQEVSQVDLDARWGSRTQIIRLSLRF